MPRRFPQLWTCRQTRSLELGGNSRMGLAGLLLASELGHAKRTTLVCASDVVVGAPGGARERDGGDAAVALVTGPDDQAIARLLGSASTTAEVLDVWRLPGGSPSPASRGRRSGSRSWGR